MCACFEIFIYALKFITISFYSFVIFKFTAFLHLYLLFCSLFICSTISLFPRSPDEVCLEIVINLPLYLFLHILTNGLLIFSIKYFLISPVISCQYKCNPLTLQFSVSFRFQIIFYLNSHQFVKCLNFFHYPT